MVTLMAGFADLDPASMPMPIAANIITAGAACEMNFDESKLAVNLFKTALYGYKTIKSLKNDNPTFDEQLWGVYYGNQAANAIKDLFSDDYVQTNGSCGTVINPGGTLIEGCRFFDLEVNRTLVVALVSNSMLKVEGKGKYQGNARLLSSYALTGTISRSDPDQTGVNCCSNGHGVFSLSSFYPGFNTSSAQGWARSNFIGAGLNNIPGLDLNINTEWGYRGGGEREDCRLVIVNGRSNESDNETVATDKRIQVFGNSVWLKNQEDGQDWQFTIVDASGRIVHFLNGRGSDVLLYDFNTTQDPTGVYYLHLRNNSGVESYKMIKAR